jgi:hypothetical protein
MHAEAATPKAHRHPDRPSHRVQDSGSTQSLVIVDPENLTARSVTPSAVLVLGGRCYHARVVCVGFRHCKILFWHNSISPTENSKRVDTTYICKERFSRNPHQHAPPIWGPGAQGFFLLTLPIPTYARSSFRHGYHSLSLLRRSDPRVVGRVMRELPD